MSTPNTSTSETFTFSLSSSDSGFQMSGPFMFPHLFSSWSVSGSHLDCVPTQPGLLVDYQKDSLDNAFASLVVCHNQKPPIWSVPQLSPPVPWPLSPTGAKHTAGLVGVTTISQCLNSTDAQCHLIFPWWPFASSLSYSTQQLFLSFLMPLTPYCYFGRK